MSAYRLTMRYLTSASAYLALALFITAILSCSAYTQNLPLFRVANGTSGENPAVLWVGVDQGFYRKHGLNVEVIFMRSGPLAMSALASSDVQAVFTSSNNVLNVAAGGWTSSSSAMSSAGSRATSWRGRKSNDPKT